MRIAFVLRYRVGLSYHVIANHLYLSKAAVRRLLHQAQMELRRLWFIED